MDVAPEINFSLSNQFSRKFRNVQKTSRFASSTAKKRLTSFLEKRFELSWEEYVVDGPLISAIVSWHSHDVFVTVPTLPTQGSSALRAGLRGGACCRQPSSACL